MNNKTIKIDDKVYELTPEAEFGERVFHQVDGEEVFYAKDVKKFLDVMSQALRFDGVFILSNRPDYDDADEDGIRFGFMPSFRLPHLPDYYWDGSGKTLA